MPALTATPAVPIRRNGASVAAFVVAASCLVYVVTWIAGLSGIEALDALYAPLRWSPAVIALPFAVFVGLQPQYGLKWQIAFLFFTLLSVLGEAQPVDSFYVLARIFIAFGLARACVTLPFAQRQAVMIGLIRFLALIVIGSILLWFLGYREIGTTSLDSSRSRISGLTSSPGMMGYVAAIVAPWALFMAMRGSTSIWRRLVFLALVAASAMLIKAADSRSGMASAAIASLCVVGLPLIRRAATTLRGVKAMHLAIGTIMLAAYAYPIAIGSGAVALGSAGAIGQSTLVRLALWQNGWESLLEHPIRGSGLATPIHVYVSRGLVEYPLYYHTALLNYLAKTGIFSGIAFFIMVYAALGHVLEQFHYLDRLGNVLTPSFARRLTTLICTNLVVLAATLTFSVTEGVLQQMYPSFLLFFLSTATLPSRDELAAVARRAG